jgi:predicted transcriptional regulator
MASTVSARIDDDLEHDLERYREQFRHPPEKSEVVREALESYLEQQISELDDTEIAEQ